jgi:hypothetical protein
MGYKWNRFQALMKTANALRAQPTVEDWVVLKIDGKNFVCKRDFSEAKRKEAAKSGAAMSDGSYPIENGGDLDNAISLVGNSSHPESEVKAHIKARAKALGLTSKLPDSWGTAMKKEDAVDLRVAKASEPAQEPPKKAGLEVQTEDDEPKHGIFAHTLGGQHIGHTVKAVANGTIAWTAVPASGKIKGGFKKHEDAKQYLADQHGEGMKAQAQQGGMGQQKPVKKFEASEVETRPPSAASLFQMKVILSKAEESEGTVEIQDLRESVAKTDKGTDGLVMKAATVSASKAAQKASANAYQAQAVDVQQPDPQAAVQAHQAAAQAHGAADAAHQAEAQKHMQTSPAVGQAHLREARYHFQQAQQHQSAARDIQDQQAANQVQAQPAN